MFRAVTNYGKVKSMRTLFLASVAAAVIATPAMAAPVTYPAMQSTIKYTRTSTGATGFGNYARATSKVVYDAATGTYTVRDTGSLIVTSTFTAANKDAAASSAEFTVYKKGANETLRTYNSGATTQGISLTYTGYGQWRRTGAPAFGTGTAVNDTYFVFGSKTPSANVPRTGSATYATALDGTFVNNTGAYAVNGTGSLTANFAGGTIGYSAAATGTKEIGGTSLAFGTMTGTGTIAFLSSGFNGTGTTNGSGYRMDVAGNFYGPAAQEVGGLFRITGGGGNGTGVVVGTRP